MNPDQTIERLYDLHPGTTPVEEGSPHERPHKPLLLLAVLDLIDEGKASADRIPWCQELRDRFSARFLLVRKHNDNRPIAKNNFRNPNKRLVRLFEIVRTGESLARINYLTLIPARSKSLSRRWIAGLITRRFDD